jgi:hypothetical protein
MSSPVEFAKHQLKSFPDERAAFSVQNLKKESGETIENALCIDPAGLKFVPNVDVDGDSKPDTVFFSCPWSGSQIRPDKCEMTVAFGNGDKLQLPEYFSLILYRSRVLAISAEIGATRTPGTGRAYRISRTGLQLVCPNL